MNFGQLKTYIASWMNRNDLTAVIPTFIELAEDRIFLGSPDLDTQPLRVGEMLVTNSAFTNPLPSTWLELKRVSWFLDGTVKYPLEFLPLERIGMYEGIGGRPQYYSINGDTLVFGPTFSNTVEVVYYARPAAMSADSDQNFLLANSPSVYLQACLMEAAIYLKDDASATRYATAFKNAIRAYQQQDDGNMHSGATLRIKSDQRVSP